MAEQPKIEITNLTYRYGDHTALDNVSLNIAPRAVTALFGPAGGGKTTLLRLINRLNDTVEGTHRRGQILIDGQAHRGRTCPPSGAGWEWCSPCRCPCP